MEGATQAQTRQRFVLNLRPLPLDRFRIHPSQCSGTPSLLFRGRVRVAWLLRPQVQVCERLGGLTECPNGLSKGVLLNRIGALSEWQNQIH